MYRERSEEILGRFFICEFKKLNKFERIPFLKMFYSASDMSKIFSPEPEVIKGIINNTIRHISSGVSSDNDIDNIIIKITKASKSSQCEILTDHDFKWLYKNERASFFFHSRFSKKNSVNNNFILDHDLRCQYVINYILIKKGTPELQLKLINEMREKWGRHEADYPLRWFFDSSDVMRKYIFAYITKYNSKTICSRPDFLNGHAEFVRRYRSITARNEIKILVAGYFDAVMGEESERSLLELKLKKALAQKKYLEKKNGEYIDKHFFLKKRNIDKLKTILEYRDVTLEEYFNDRIERDYRNSVERASIADDTTTDENKFGW